MMPRKYDTAPARMRMKREVATTWDIHSSGDFFAPPPSLQAEASDASNMPCKLEDAMPPPPPPVAMRSATVSGAPAYARGNSADWNAHGSGSWGRISKRRTSEENAMSLWDVHEALKTSVAPPAPSRAPTMAPPVAPRTTPMAPPSFVQRVPKPAENVVEGLGLLDALVADLGEAPPTQGPTPTETECAEGDAPALDPDELLAMLHPDADAWHSPAIAMPESVEEGPSSPSPTSVTTLFGEALCDSTAATAAAPAAAPPALTSAEIAQKVESCAHLAAQQAALHHASAATQGAPGSYEAAYHAAYDAAYQAAHQAAQQHHTQLAEPPAAAPAAPASYSTALTVAPPAAPMGRNGAERKEWTTVEDDIIRELMSVHGCKWRRIAAQLPGRSDDAVRNRWNRLKELSGDGPPSLPSGLISPPPIARRNTSSSSDLSASKPERVSWTRVEDETILLSVQELGHKWNKLAERLPGRTDHAIRNRFHRLQTMMEDKQRVEQLTFAPPEPLPEAIEAFAF